MGNEILAKSGENSIPDSLNKIMPLELNSNE
jgi:hypothetical protein